MAHRPAFCIIVAFIHAILPVSPITSLHKLVIYTKSKASIGSLHNYDLYSHMICLYSLIEGFLGNLHRFLNDIIPVGFLDIPLVGDVEYYPYGCFQNVCCEEC